MKKILLISAIGLLCIQNVSAQEKMSKDDRENLARQQFDDGEYQKSLTNYNILLKDDENNASYLNGRGLAYFRLGNYQKAKQNFAMATLFSQKDATIWSNLSAAYNNLNENEKAYETAVKALRYGKSALTVFNAASNANNVERLDEALSILDNAGEFRTNAMEDLYARVYSKKNDYHNSIKHFEIFFKNFDDNDKITFNVLSEKRSYFFALMGKLADEAATSPPKDNALLKELFEELANSTGYEFDSKFALHSSYEMIRAIKKNSAYREYFLEFVKLIKDKDKAYILLNELNDTENYK
ncbi:tetratricopeptide repeat protein [Chryseobacterium sp. TY4]